MEYENRGDFQKITEHLKLSHFIRFYGDCAKTIRHSELLSGAEAITVWLNYIRRGLSPYKTRTLSLEVAPTTLSTFFLS